MRIPINVDSTEHIVPSQIADGKEPGREEQSPLQRRDQGIAGAEGDAGDEAGDDDGTADVAGAGETGADEPLGAAVGLEVE